MKKYFLVILAILLVSLPFVLFNVMTNYSGTDDKSVSVIEQVAPDYTPWINNMWEPQSDFSEAILFALQTAIGVFIIALYVVYSYKNKKYKV